MEMMSTRREEKVSVSEDVCEWMRDLAGKVREIEVRLEGALEAVESKDRELKWLQGGHRSRDLVIDKLKCDLVNLEMCMDSSMARVRDLEIRMKERLEERNAGESEDGREGNMYARREWEH